LKEQSHVVHKETYQLSHSTRFTQVREKLSLCWTKYHSMKTYWGS